MPIAPVLLDRLRSAGLTDVTAVEPTEGGLAALAGIATRRSGPPAFAKSFVSPASVDAASSWTTVTPVGAVLAPGGGYTATVTVTIPAAARAGSYYAVVWAGPRAQAAKPGSVTLATYAGIREHLTVS